MALNLFGITHDIVRQLHFPTIIAFSANSKPTSTAVGIAISDVAADVCALLLEKGIDQDAIFTDNSATYPIAYQRIASAIRKGAACKVADSISQKDAELVKRWEGEFKGFKSAVRTNGYLALGDAPEPTEQSVGPTDFVTELNLDIGDQSLVSDAIPPFRKDDVT